MTADIGEETLQDLINLETGLFAPLSGFMNRQDFRAVVDHCTLSSGEIFTIPITLDLPETAEKELYRGCPIRLRHQGRIVGELTAEDWFHLEEADLERVFHTLDRAHPGVAKELGRSPLRVGGPIRLLDPSLLENVLTPEKTRKLFSGFGWKTVAGFQTRNPIHKAHEYLQRLALERCDGLFINPITGWKKAGDFTEEAVIAAYQAMIGSFYPAGRVYLEGLRTQMRYAGPREAIFHAIIRRNLGCTHFIIGRDHAGVGGYYGPYEAHELAAQLKGRLGIELLLCREPYYCRKCAQIVTDKTCAHYQTHREAVSGTQIREYIRSGSLPDERFMRQEVLDAITHCKQIFIDNT